MMAYQEKFCRYGNSGRGHFVDVSKLTFVKSDSRGYKAVGHYICDDCAPKAEAGRKKAQETSKGLKCP
jgi:hypothetical protein